VWIVHIYDCKEKGCFDVLIFEMDELQETLKFINESNRFILENVESRDMFVGLEDWQECLNENDNDSPDNIPDKI